MKSRLPFSTRARMVASLLTLAGLMALIASGGGEGDSVIVEIRSGATSQRVSSVLAANDIVGSARLFHAYIRIRGADRSLKAGTYQMRTRSSMRQALGQLSRGEVETVAVTVPEGLAFWQLAPILAGITGDSDAAIAEALQNPSLTERFSVPGPTLEGYLFPDTYRFARGVPLEAVIDAMVERYRSVWTDERRMTLAASGMTEQEVVTLASIIQTEARQVSEMPRISGVYHNRIRDGWLLQADPTVIYALGGYRERLLYAAIDSVADNPYNTYTQRGLPPGPIASPGEQAIDAALQPERHAYWFFVARPDGYHVFTQTLAEHNRAKEEQREARGGA
ncbi:MAG: endolytic transglycosylase MltG [Longimicrobiales bacterium]|nr:endolytic transglycosylase MltG [Longimicrobiales bacterium]